MLRRLLSGLLPLLAVVTLLVAVPLAVVIADRTTQRVYQDRADDADAFAVQADRGLRDGHLEALAGALQRYREVYGIDVWVLGVDGAPVLPSRSAAVPASVRDDPAVLLARRGVRAGPPSPVLPWTGSGLLVARPVGPGGDVLGAVVTLSPTGRLRREVLTGWGLLGAGALGIALVLALAAVPFSRWLLRPVDRLDAAAAQLAAGDLGSRVRLAGGPPELRRLAVSFDRMAEAVQTAVHRQQQFVGDASHQLRNPVTSLKLTVENLGHHLTDPQARTEHRAARRDLDDLGRLLDSLLALTRVGGAPAEPVELDEVIAAALDRWSQECRDAGLRLELDVDEHCRALAPAGGLGHLLDELVSNAVRLSGGTLVEVRARHDGRTVTIEVRDDGRGLDRDGREQATHRFWRSPAQQNTPGSGLGLAIVAELVSSVGGRVELADAGPGLRVLVELPAA